MNTRFFSALAAVAMSTAIAGTAMAHQSGGDANVPATQTSTQGATQNANQSTALASQSQAQSMHGGTGFAAQPSNDDQNATGVIGVKVGPGPGYAWWKDR